MNTQVQKYGSLDVPQSLQYHDDNLQFLFETWCLFTDLHADDGNKLHCLVGTESYVDATLLVHSLKNIAALIGAGGLELACATAEERVKNGEKPSCEELAAVTTRLDEALEDAQALIACHDLPR